MLSVTGNSVEFLYHLILNDPHCGLNELTKQIQQYILAFPSHLHPPTEPEGMTKEAFPKSFSEYLRSLCGCASKLHPGFKTTSTKIHKLFLDTLTRGEQGTSDFEKLQQQQQKEFANTDVAVVGDEYSVREKGVMWPEFKCAHILQCFTKENPKASKEIIQLLFRKLARVLDFWANRMTDVVQLDKINFCKLVASAQQYCHAQAQHCTLWHAAEIEAIAADTAERALRTHRKRWSAPTKMLTLALGAMMGPALIPEGYAVSGSHLGNMIPQPGNHVVFDHTGHPHRIGQMTRMQVPPGTLVGNEMVPKSWSMHGRRLIRVRRRPACMKEQDARKLNNKWVAIDTPDDVATFRRLEAKRLCDLLQQSAEATQSGKHPHHQNFEEMLAIMQKDKYDGAKQVMADVVQIISKLGMNLDDYAHIKTTYRRLLRGGASGKDADSVVEWTDFVERRKKSLLEVIENQASQGAIKIALKNINIALSKNAFVDLPLAMDSETWQYNTCKTNTFAQKCHIVVATGPPQVRPEHVADEGIVAAIERFASDLYHLTGEVVSRTIDSLRPGKMISKLQPDHVKNLPAMMRIVRSYGNGGENIDLFTWCLSSLGAYLVQLNFVWEYLLDSATGLYTLSLVCKTARAVAYRSFTVSTPLASLHLGPAQGGQGPRQMMAIQAAPPEAAPPRPTNKRKRQNQQEQRHAKKPMKHKPPSCSVQ